MPKLGRGRILIWEGGSLWIMEAVSPNRQRARLNDPHSHHAVQVTLALEGDFEFESGEHRVAGDVVAVARALFAGDEPLARVEAIDLDDLAMDMAAAFGRPRRDDQELAALGRSVIERLAGRGDGASEPDARVRRIVTWAQEQLDRPIGLADAADLVGLSKARLRHLFVEQTGLPFRTYLLWLRLMKGLEEYSAGASLTDAAHDAGFADSAHFSRTFRRMFGTTAAALDVR